MPRQARFYQPMDFCPAVADSIFIQCLSIAPFCHHATILPREPLTAHKSPLTACRAPCRHDLNFRQAVMTDPVMLRGESDGQSYERRYLEAHLAQSRCIYLN